jgi:hypothetical protein
MAGRVQLAGHGLDRFSRDPGQDHFGSLAGHLPGRGRANAAAPAGDQSDSIV